MPAKERPPTLDDLIARRERIVEIAARHGALNVRVFGSVARNRARVDSDVDLLVDLEPGRGVLDVSELILDLEDELKRRVDVVVTNRSAPTAGRLTAHAVAL